MYVNKPILVFDFDGTIADTFQLVIEIFNKYATLYGYPKLDAKTIFILRNKSAKDVIRYLKIPILKLPFFMKKAMRDIKSNVKDIPSIAGIKHELIQLKKDGYSINILTSNKEENVKEFLKIQAYPHFDHIYTGRSIFGKSKLMNQFINETKLDRSNILYIGDEVRDIEAAKKIKLKIVSVTWGFNSKEILEQNKPDYIISKPSELRKILDAI
jgi:phosphoglycolate phosphatase